MNPLSFDDASVKESEPESDFVLVVPASFIVIALDEVFDQMMPFDTL